jgi:hypothetical protein
MDDLRVIDMYHDAIQNDIPPENRRGHWAQEYYQMSEVLNYIECQFKDTRRIRRICEEMRVP